MTQKTVARLGGSAIIAWLLATAAAYLISIEVAFPWVAAGLMLGSPLVALLFALPGCRPRVYAANAVMTVLVAAVVIGLNHRSVDEDVTDRVAFAEGFTLAVVPATSGVILGGLALAALRRRSRSRPASTRD